MPKHELILGAGNNTTKRIRMPEEPEEFDNPIKLDIDQRSNPDIVWDLNERPLPFEDNSFDEIHAYEVLEHIGRQGDWRDFFDEWSEYHRILKPGGTFHASVPALRSRWLWGDPGHTRVISLETLSFLDQSAYTDQIGSTAMTDYRFCYSGDFRLKFEMDDGSQFWFVLEKK